MNRNARAGSVGVRIEFDPALVEECVLLTLAQRSEDDQKAFRKERDVLYDVADAEERENLFRNLHAAWFESLRLGDGIVSLLEEYPFVLPRISRCAALRVHSRRQEGINLHDARDENCRAAPSLPVLVMRLQPSTFLNEREMTPLARRELLRASDMLDPQFGFVRSLLESQNRTPAARLSESRCLVAWDASIDGRLVAAGKLPAEVEQERYREFLQAFPMLGDETAKVFRIFFSRKRPTHRELLNFGDRQFNFGFLFGIS